MRQSLPSRPPGPPEIYDSVFKQWFAESRVLHPIALISAGAIGIAVRDGVVVQMTVRIVHQIADVRRDGGGWRWVSRGGCSFSIFAFLYLKQLCGLFAGHVFNDQLGNSHIF